MSAVPSPAPAPRRSPTRPPIGWWLALTVALPIVGYALAVVVLGERLYPPNPAESFLARPWGINPHALFGSLALGLGILQFNRWLINRHRPWHRALGMAYVISAVVVGLAGCT